MAEEAMDALRGALEVETWPDPDAPPPHEVILQKVRDLDALLCLLTDRIDAEVIGAANKLRVISNCAVGYDNIDIAAATSRGILVCNTPGVLTETTADLAWALLMAAARRLGEAERYLRAGRWKSWSPQLMLGHDIYGATLGLVGLGRIGQAVAKRARGFDMRVLYHDIAPRREAEESVNAERADLDALLRSSDFVSLHVPLTEETHHLIGRRELALMKPSAVLVNTSRGPVVDQGALADALREGMIFAAGLDVFEAEPLSADSSLLALENVVLLPHIGSASVATRTRMAQMAADNLLAGLRGERPAHIVNPEVLSG
jgi:glyoxylate reductase